MHEESLARTLIAQTTDLCHRHGAIRVLVIRVSCGALSGVEPLLLQDAFERLRGSTGMLAAAELVLEDPGLPARCCECGQEFQVADFRFVCGACGSTEIQITDGDSLKVLDVQLELAEAG
ncbi:MAG: hypothetical protein RL215_409 [Planctomycetota bacterium]|jgi:hydrogenase nickel incorporation protein HypA/HybF